MINYLGKTGLEHLIGKIRTELRELQELIAESDEESETAPLSEWTEVQQIVRNGLAKETFSVGDTFQCNHKDYGVLTWQIIGFDQETPVDTSYTHSMTLQLKDVLRTMSYSGPSVLYEATTGLLPGDYWFPLPDATGIPKGDGESATFTLTKEIPEGGGLVYRLPASENAFEGTVESYENLSSFPLLESVSVSSGQTGEQLFEFQAPDKIYWGNYQWKTSGIRQYLNSEETKENVWRPVESGDACPEWAGTLDGFALGLDEDFKNVLGAVQVSEYDRQNKETVYFEEKFFLPSPAQVYAMEESAWDANSYYEYYYNTNGEYSSSLSAQSTLREKTLNGDPCGWWLRTPPNTDMFKIYAVGKTGEVTGERPIKTDIGVSPVCCII